MTDPHSEHAAGGNQTGLFLKVFGALCVLTAISFAVASSPLMNDRTVGWTLMLGVSCAKAFLVISYFMHLRWERAWKYALTLPTVVIAILLVAALVPDIARRTRHYAESRWRHASEGTMTADSADDHQATEPRKTDPLEAATPMLPANPEAAAPASDGFATESDAGGGE